MYQLVFRGEWASGLDEASARERARGLFKANEAQLEKMFSGNRVVIRNRLDEAMAHKYQAAMKKNGLVAHIEPMQQGAAAAADTRPSESVGEGVAVEPGDRLPVAGDKVDSILASSDLSLGAPGEQLGETREDTAPVFQHLDQWSVAPPGEALGPERGEPEPSIPDVSHLSLENSE